MLHFPIQICLISMSSLEPETLQAAFFGSVAREHHAKKGVEFEWKVSVMQHEVGGAGCKGLSNKGRVTRGIVYERPVTIKGRFSNSKTNVQRRKKKKHVPSYAGFHIRGRERIYFPGHASLRSKNACIHKLFVLPKVRSKHNIYPNRKLMCGLKGSAHIPQLAAHLKLCSCRVVCLSCSPQPQKGLFKTFPSKKHVPLKVHKIIQWVCATQKIEKLPHHQT